MEKTTASQKARKKQKIKTTANPKTQPNREEKYITETFKTLFIELTNIAMTNIINNGHYFYNFFSISISASGVLTR